VRFGLRHRSRNYAVKLDGIARNFKHRRICNSFAAVFVLKFNSASGYSFANCGRDFSAQTETSRLEIPHALKFDLI